MFKLVSETKVGDYHISVAVQEEVLELEVAMDNFLLVNVPDTGNELGKEFGSVLFAKIAMSKDVVEKLSTRCIFQDDANVLVSFDHVVEANDVGMFQGLRWILANKTYFEKDVTYTKNLDFPFHLGHANSGVDVSTSDELDSDFLSPLTMQSQLDLPELSLS